MTKHSSNTRQLVDWRSAVWAGFGAGIIFLLLNLFLVPIFTGGNAWVVIRLLASIGLGSDVLAPPATFHGSALVVGLLIHFSLSILFSCTLAFMTHRWGLITAIILGGCFGLAVYLINIYTFTMFFPWLYGMKHIAFLISHVIFGMCAGAIYEVLEVEVFEPVKELKAGT